ncbi:LysE family translocator [Jhaorihella thermophila]|uniref:Threonine/homoserine/homoserine lactone efflux protein n=1 Tax=Jhaorihella thermophila TaxID=488547 RepID=A0A1H5TUA0_9RHOB|nr:LysE family translocator [Jhaorihella thermophila]SEF65798.1 Threonine/homoserine/homoserine lactone efflux protein [Jhaorihella thermophila]
MDLSLWLAFVAATVVVLIIPGPTILLVLSYALSKGRSVAVASAGGVALGDFVAMTTSLAGLGALVATSAAWFTALKWVGAAYLLYLGVKLLRSAPSAGLEAVTPSREVTARGVFGHAAAVTALNPKSIAFFIAFVPQFIHPSEPLGPQFAVLIATFVALGALNALAYALAADRLRRWIGRPRVVRGMTQAGGLTLIGMGLATAVLRRPV